MSNKLTIVMSGKKQSGKSSSCNYIVSKVFNRLYPNGTPWDIDDQGTLIGKSARSLAEAWHFAEQEKIIKIYSFADPLKRFCIDVLGAPEESCYGDDEQKNKPIEHLLWDKLSMFLRWTAGGQQILKDGQISTVRFGDDTEANFWHLWKTCTPVGIKEGPMTGRELMQMMGTDFCRKLYHDCWARGTYSAIKREGYKIALVCDGRFPNEITMGNSLQAITIRLLRAPFTNDQHPSETALDDFPLNQFTHVLDNKELSLPEQCQLLNPIVDNWLKKL